MKWKQIPYQKKKSKIYKGGEGMNGRNGEVLEQHQEWRDRRGRRRVEIQEGEEILNSCKERKNGCGREGLK